MKKFFIYYQIKDKTNKRFIIDQNLKSCVPCEFSNEIVSNNYIQCVHMIALKQGIKKNEIKTIEKEYIEMVNDFHKVINNNDK